MPPVPRLIASWILVAIYATGIFVWSSFSKPPLVPQWDIPDLDKLYHTIEYAVLAFLLIRALRITCLTRSEMQLIWWGVALTACYGLSDELHQAFTPGRAMSVYDLVADAVGASVVGLVWPRIQRRWPAIVNLAEEEQVACHERSTVTRVDRS